MEVSVLNEKLNQLPEHLRNEVADFIEFLLIKSQQAPKEQKKRPVFGSAKGMFTMHPDFDEPLEDFKKYM